MNILITGARGFVGKNLLTHIGSEKKYKIIILEKHDSNFIFDKKIFESDIIFHLAGVNRSKFKKDFLENNYNLTKKIIDTLKKKKKKTKIIFASSTQVALDNNYAISKKNAEKILIKYNKEKNSNLLIFRLPNIFGKWSKPFYNSVVATFCHQVARNKKIYISNKKTKITLLYIDDLISQFVKKINFNKEKKIIIKPINSFKISLLDLANLIKSFKAKKKTDLINYLEKPIVKKIYSTYVSFLPKKDFIYKIKKNNDHRGQFVEFAKNNSFGQFSFFSILPGKMRGNHFHHTKLEKFAVVQGKVKFNFLDLATKKKFSAVVEEKKNYSMVVNTIPGSAHNIENIGSNVAILVAWCNEIYNPNNSDTFFFKV